MWNGNVTNSDDPETARRILALAHQSGAMPPAFGVAFSYDPQSEYQRQLALQSMHHLSPQVLPPAATASSAVQGPPTWDSSVMAPPGPKFEEASSATAVSMQARGKPEAIAAQLSSASRVQSKLEELKAEGITGDHEEASNADDQTNASVATEEGKASNKPSGSSNKKRKRSSTPKKAVKKSNHSVLTMDDPAQPITAAEYENLQAMMVQFCRVPLLAEFSRPVSLLHPELMGMYSKIVPNPMDLGRVCRKIRRKEYACLRDVRLDAWRIFSNCVRYHSHPSNKEAVPSFVSIALHLRDYFNDLWQEYMMPSDPPSPPAKSTKSNVFAYTSEAMKKRKESRKHRIMVSALSVMTGKALGRAIQALNALIDNGGCADRLDAEHLWGEGSEQTDKDISVLLDNLVQLAKRLESTQEREEEYGVDELDRDIRKCYSGDLFENNPSLKIKVANRLDRFIGKIVVPINEATCRGVSQSSIWGCMAAGVWARESSKKAYWPALVLGIMAPEDRKEDWHAALTKRNEKRLPEKLRSQLISGKRKAEQAIKRQSQGQADPQSYFLVEFMGTHEFIWVRESDIVENFDPSEDPNEQATLGSKKKTRSNLEKVLGSKLYATAIEEAKWAQEEFDLQLQDVGTGETEEDDDGEMNYSYAVLCQSDEEADDAESGDDDDVDTEENNEMLASDGLIDFANLNRKKANKKKPQSAKKAKSDGDKKGKSKVKVEDLKQHGKDSKKQEKELEKRRKKRTREREKALKGGEPKSKSRRLSESEDLKKAPSGRRNLIAGKRDRATAIVNGYLKRTIERDEYKTLCLGASIGEGILTIPAAMIDSFGIVGLSLAYRAAAGELPMPSESGDQSSSVKPWDAIEVEEKKKSKEREELLEKQIEMLEKEIDRVQSNTAQRLKLLEDAKAKKAKMLDVVEAEDQYARQNPLKNKKKGSTPDKKGKGSSSKSPSGKADDEDDDDSKSAENQDDMEIEVEAEEDGLSENEEDDGSEKGAESVHSNSEDMKASDEEVQATVVF